MKKKNKYVYVCIISGILLVSGYYALNQPEIEYNTVPVFQAWSHVENLDNLTKLQQISKHDLVFHDSYAILEVTWDDTGEPYRGLKTALYQNNMASALEIRNELKELNPNIKILVAILYREGNYVSLANEGENWWEKGHFPPDSAYWLKNSTGDRVIGWGENTNLNGHIDEDDTILSYLVDFTNPEVQDLISNKAKAYKDSGLFDGIFLDWMGEFSTTDDAAVPGWDPILTQPEELAARVAILTKIREKTGDEFLILGNMNNDENSILAPLLNGAFMECPKNSYSDTYSNEQLSKIQSAVIFNQKHLAEPALVCLEGWEVSSEYNPSQTTRIVERNSPENLQTMRFFTTMSLTLSDGYVLFGDDNALPFWDHLHNWYDFWEAPIGSLVSDYQELYNKIDSLYIREFENAWVVYNFSGISQQIEFSRKLTSVSDNSISKIFTIANKDGGIFLKS